MFRLGIIEESLKREKTLNLVKPYFFSQRIENVPDDEYPTWHTNEYHVPDEKIEELIFYFFYPISEDNFFDNYDIVINILK